jgi:hypothetical protein
VQAAQGEAAAGNTHPANTLVVVTDPVTGMAVTGLRPEDFTVINHFSLPHQRCGFSNNITSFTDVGTGAYRVQVGLSAEVERCTWVRGEYLMQVIVTSGSRSGQGTAILRIW